MFTKPTHVPQVQAKYTTDSAQVRRVQVLWVRLKRNVDEVYLPSSEQGPMGSRYPTRPELFFKYPTRKLKMTRYQVIIFHLDINKTQSWMRNSAIKVTNPINPGTGNHFFVIFWGKWSRTGAVIFSQCLTPIDLTWLDWQGERECTTAPCVCSQ